MGFAGLKVMLLACVFICKLRLSCTQTRLFHLMCMSRRHSGCKQFLYFSFQVSEFFVSFVSADNSPLFSSITFSASVTRAHTHTYVMQILNCAINSMDKLHKPSKDIICLTSRINCVPYWPVLKPRLWRQLIIHLFWLFHPSLPMLERKGAWIVSEVFVFEQVAFVTCKNQDKYIS